MTHEELLLKYDEIGFRILQVEDSPNLHALENELEELRGEIWKRMNKDRSQCKPVSKKKNLEPKLKSYDCEVRWVEKHTGYENIGAYTKEDAEEKLKRHVQDRGFEALRNQHWEITNEKYKVKEQ